jgi:hypothetical protein
MARVINPVAPHNFVDLFASGFNARRRPRKHPASRSRAAAAPGQAASTPAGEELGAGHLGHLVVGDEHGHRDVLIGQLAQHRQSRGGRRGTANPEILAEPPAEIIPQCPHDPGSWSITNKAGCGICSAL